jgi:hypothetical protein
MATTQTFALSLGMGIMMIVLVILCNLIVNQTKVSGTLLQWIALPALAYCIALGLNAIVQLVSCGSIRIKQLAVGAVSVPAAVLGFLVLSLIPFVRAPISQILPQKYSEMSDYVALLFYMFWAGMFGEAMAGGLAQSCSK